MKLQLFFSWQMETTEQGLNNKKFLLECIAEAIEKVDYSKELKGVEIHFAQGMSEAEGTPILSDEMFGNVDNCDIYIADLTTAQRMSKEFEEYHNQVKDGKFIYFRYGPNNNAYGEYNRALGKHPLFSKQIILVLNTANMSPEEDIRVIPCDTRDRRWPIEFRYERGMSKEKKEREKTKLVETLTIAIEKSAVAALKYRKTKYQPFVSWYEQATDGRIKEVGDIRKEAIELCASRLAKVEGVVQVIGTSGFDTTQIIHETITDDGLRNNYFYVDNDYDEYDEYKKPLRDLLKPNSDVLLVIDHCNNGILGKIIAEKDRSRADNKILCIYHSLKDEVKATEKSTIVDLSDIINEVHDEVYASRDMAFVEFKDNVSAFCEGNISYINTILSKYQKLRSKQELTPKELVTLLTDISPDTYERRILQTISLFDTIGWKEDRSREREYVLLNMHITSIDNKPEFIINEATNIVNRLKDQGLIREKGRTISITLKPLANQLTTEWLQAVDNRRFIKVLETFRECEFGKWLTRSFRDRFVHMGIDDVAKEFVGNLLNIGGIFDNVKVLDTPEGSMLIDSFAAVNPSATMALFTRVFNALSFDELRKVYDGRRQLIWTIEKLCFRSEYFEEAALVLLRLAVAENDDNISNNATGEFIRLFPVLLPATNANLTNRLRFLQNHIHQPDYNPIIMRALRRALMLRDYILMNGADKLGDDVTEPYMPQKVSEIRTYVEECLNLIETEYMQNSTKRSLCIQTIEDAVSSICMNGYAGIVLPVVERVSATMNDNWESLRETMTRSKERVWPHMSKMNQRKYSSILKKLTKTDILSRFKRIEEDVYVSTKKIPFESRIKQRQEAYSNISKEIYRKRLLTNALLGNLMSVPNIHPIQFGSTLAGLMDRDEQVKFVKDYIRIMNKNEKATDIILCDFVRQMDEDAFVKALPHLKKSRISRTLFQCMGYRNITPDMTEFAMLHKQIAQGKATVAEYHHYFNTLSFEKMNHSVILGLFEAIMSHADGFLVLMDISSTLLLNNQQRGNDVIDNYLNKTILEFSGSPEWLLTEDACQVEGYLLQGGERKELAKRVNEVILNYVSHQDFYHSSYTHETIYRLLMRLYFKDIWPRLSEILLSDGPTYMEYYRVKSLLGLDMVRETTPVILEGGHFKEMLPWCDSHPDVAPARLASLIKVDGAGDTFSEEAMILINRYTDRQYVLNELECSLDSFGSIGSTVPYYERRKRIYATVLNHPNELVRQWAQRCINGMERSIQDEKNRNAEDW